MGVGERRRRRPPPQRGGKAEMAQLGGGGRGDRKGKLILLPFSSSWGEARHENKRVFRPRTTFTMPLTLPGVCKKSNFFLMSHKYYAYQKSERFHTEDWKLSGSASLVQKWFFKEGRASFRTQVTCWRHRAGFYVVHFPSPLCRPLPTRCSYSRLPFDLSAPNLTPFPFLYFCCPQGTGGSGVGG